MTWDKNQLPTNSETGYETEPDHPQTAIKDADLQKILQTRDIDLLKIPPTPLSTDPTGAKGE